MELTARPEPYEKPAGEDVREEAQETLAEKAGSATERLAGAAQGAKEHISETVGNLKEGRASVRDRAGRVQAGAKRAARGGYIRARRQARNTGRSLVRGFREHPLVMCTAAAAAGLAVGIMLPHTRREDEIMGQSRDRLMGEAKELGHETFQKTQAIAGAAVEAVRDEARKQHLEAQELAGKAQAVVERAAETAGQEASETQRPPEQPRKAA